MSEVITIATVSIESYIDEFNNIDELKKAAKVLIAQDIEKIQSLESELEQLKKENLELKKNRIKNLKPSLRGLFIMQ